jgi:hypothetical protein
MPSERRSVSRTEGSGPVARDTAGVVRPPRRDVRRFRAGGRDSPAAPPRPNPGVSAASAVLRELHLITHPIIFGLAALCFRTSL